MNCTRELFCRTILTLGTVFFTTALSSAVWQWGQPPIPSQGELRAIIMTPEPGTVIRKDTAILVDIAGIKSYDDVKKLEYYVDSTLIMEEKSVPYSDGLFLIRKFEDGIHLITVRFILKNGQITGHTIPVISAKTADTGRLAA